MAKDEAELTALDQINGMQPNRFRDSHRSWVGWTISEDGSGRIGDAWVGEAKFNRGMLDRPIIPERLKSAHPGISSFWMQFAVLCKVVSEHYPVFGWKFDGDGKLYERFGRQSASSSTASTTM